MSRHPQRRAFTRIEMLACLACVALLGALAIPVLATGPSRSQNAQCLNNLRLIGRAVQMWGMENRESVPWHVLTSDGGSGGSPKPGNAWFEFLVMSNQLGTPRILSCPADTAAVVASEFTGNPSGGYLHPAYRARATSYFINLHTLSEQPRSIITGDRNVRVSSSPVNCVWGVVNADAIDPNDPSAGWTNGVHGHFGNVVLMDGSVAETTASQFRTLIKEPDGNGSAHLLRAR